MRIIYIILLCFSCLASAYAGSSIPGQLTISTGSISVSYSENDNIVQDSSSTGVAPFSGTATALPLTLGYEYFPNLQRSYFFRATGPLMGSTPDRYFSGSGGVNFFFGKLASQATVRDLNFEMKLIPKLRYYAGPAIGVGYLVYNTTTAAKNDILFELGGQAGAIYTLNSKWSLKGELGFSRAIGALVSATVIKISLGATYTVGP